MQIYIPYLHSSNSSISNGMQCDAEIVRYRETARIDKPERESEGARIVIEIGIHSGLVKYLVGICVYEVTE